METTIMGPSCERKGNLCVYEGIDQNTEQPNLWCQLSGVRIYNIGLYWDNGKENGNYYNGPRV